MSPNMSESIPTLPNVFGCVRLRPNTSEHLLKHWRPSKNIQKTLKCIQNRPEMSNFVRMLPNASESIWIDPNRSEWIRTSQKTFKLFNKYSKAFKNVGKTFKNFWKNIISTARLCYISCGFRVITQLCIGAARAEVISHPAIGIFERFFKMKQKAPNNETRDLRQPLETPTPGWGSL